MSTREAIRQTVPESVSRSSHLPVLALLLATVFWGMGFTWAKSAGEAINARAALPAGAALGPVLLLAVRFTCGAMLWLALFPAARKGWSRRSLRRGGLMGLILAMGLISQHMGLDRTSEAVSAFLTNLTIIFVPLLIALLSRRWPAWRLGAAILMALTGIYLMTGAASQGFGRGEWLGLACSILFSIYIVVLDRGSIGEDAFQLTAIQFVVVGLVCFAVAFGLARGHAPAMSVFVADRSVMWNAILLTVLTTVGSFGLMVRFQPRIDPTRAALIYLAEPIVASMWAWWTVGRTLAAIAIFGAALIVAANLLAGRGGSEHMIEPV